MKVLGLNGSTNEHGVTYTAMNIVGDQLKKEGIDLEIYHVGAEGVHGCLNCMQCRKDKVHRCVINDKVNTIIDKLDEYDGLLLGSPTHFMNIPGPFKAFLDRLFYATENLSGRKLKVGAAITVCRRAGAIDSLHQLNNYFCCSNMITVNSYYWNIVHGWNPDEFLAQDKEGVRTMEVLGQNMAWLLKSLNASRDIVPLPVFTEERVRTNFCR